MHSVSKCCVALAFMSISICNKLVVHAILNGDGGTTTPIVSSTAPVSKVLNFPEGQAHHQIQQSKGIRRTARKREFQRTFPLTAAPPAACECMDYWECISNNGHVYSYCGINDSEVCCFHKQKLAGNVDRLRNRDNLNGSNNAIRSLPQDVTIVSTSTPPATSTRDIFSTGNTVSLNDGNGFTTSSPNLVSGSTLPDVDYFYSLEDGVGDLKQITTSTVTEKSEEVTAEASYIRNYSGSSCGTQSVEWKLNSKAEFKEWPWHVALLEINQDLYICGGTIITNSMVVTAAHCVNSYTRRNAAKLKVRAGEYDVSTNDEPDPYIEVAVEEIFVHPQFNNATLVNDIALVKLRRPLNYTSNVMPICLPQETQRSHHPKNCVVTGWGRETEASPFSVVLKEIVVPLWEHEECQEKLQRNFGSSYELAETSLCAGKRGHDACDGDGGGGLVCFDEQSERFYLKGITSFGIGCGRLETPGVYTNLNFYTSWIEASLFYLEEK